MRFDHEDGARVARSRRIERGRCDITVLRAHVRILGREIFPRETLRRRRREEPARRRRARIELRTARGPARARAYGFGGSGGQDMTRRMLTSILRTREKRYGTTICARH